MHTEIKKRIERDYKGTEYRDKMVRELTQEGYYIYCSGYYRGRSEERGNLVFTSVIIPAIFLLILIVSWGLLVR